MNGTANHKGAMAGERRGHGPETPTARRAQQERARDKLRAISGAAGRVIATHGISGLTHRLVAEKAHVSLAATTYHFNTKADIIEAATQATLGAYDLSFRRALDRFRHHDKTPQRLRDYLTSLMRNTAGRAHARAVCWGEIMLDAQRRPSSLQLTRAWYQRTTGVWEELMFACGIADARARAISAIDILAGMLMLTAGLGLTECQIEHIFAGEADLLDFRPEASAPVETPPVRGGAKAMATRAKILAATIDVLSADGPGAVNSRTVAEAAGVTKAAPFYYFDSVADLLAAAQSRLFDRSKDRYRRGLSDIGGSDPDVEGLVDRTAAVFLREATEYSAESVANYSIWLRADRQPAVRAMSWEATSDQHLAWRAVLRRWKPDLTPLDPLLCQALFIGKLVRMLATGSRIEDLSAVRREFSQGLNDVLTSSTAIR